MANGSDSPWPYRYAHAKTHRVVGTATIPNRQLVIRIATAISTAGPNEAEAALKKVLALSPPPATRKAAEAALRKIH